MSKPRVRLGFVDEPSGPAYRELIDRALETGGEALLVIRDDIPLSDAGKRFLDKLSASVVRQETSSQWPGTVLLDGSAKLVYLTITPLVAEALKGATDRLFGWVQPDLPEDLCFFTTGGDVWLVSIAHEADAYMEVAASESGPLLERGTALSELLRREELDQPSA